ncbi:hypothetical protein CAP36_12555 [Chitinophagaceae bacterium IBVUCB2]|nr:hypothetical protein CAP36_12555 [Chitinophagaceae bacterium IBVUCB2]
MKPSKSYLQFVKDLKQTITQSRYQATRLANRGQLLLYFKSGKMLSEKILSEKWGMNILGQIASDLQQQMPGLRGFSSRNLQKMRQLYSRYADTVLGQLVTAQLEEGKLKIKEATFTPLATAQVKTVKSVDNHRSAITPVATAKLDNDILNSFYGVSFTHHILILDKCNSFDEGLYYMRQAANLFWTVTVLEHQINSRLFEKQGTLPNNFEKSVIEELKPSAVEIFHDEYLMDYMNLSETDDERDVENKIVANIRDFILRMGKGFSFIGNQFRVELDGDEFFIDLLFFNRHLRCLVAFELKKGKFKPEYVGQLNFYLNVLDEKIKLSGENNSIGIVLCKEKSNTVVEYSVKSIANPMGVATFKTTRQMPNEIKEILPNTLELGIFL